VSRAKERAWLKPRKLEKEPKSDFDNVLATTIITPVAVAVSRSWET
jgi:hypothetical protein